MLEDKYADFEKFMAENKGKRKFKQTVELAINFKGINFNDQNNRLNLSVLLPNGRGKSSKIAVFTSDRNMAEEAKKSGAEVIGAEEIPAIANDKQRLNALLAYDLLAQSSLMPNIARFLGQFLGPRGKMPKPVMPGTSISKLASDSARQITVKSSGKFLPTVHCPVGTEDMEPAKLFENIKEVLNAVVSKVSKNNIKSVYVKLTMSKPERLM
ncbi:MAG: 50S ribosomal protein L1 [Candidatus Micrarchaeia archaeon]